MNDLRQRERLCWIGDAEGKDAENEPSCKIKAHSVLGPRDVPSKTLQGYVI